MRLAFLGIVVAAALAIAGTAYASAGPTRTVAFEATATGTVVLDYGNCCGTVREVEGRARLKPGGRATFTTVFRFGTFSAENDAYRLEQTTVFTTKRGDSLTLYTLTSTPGEQTWTVVAGTGRFAGAEGTGAFTYDFTWTETGVHVVEMSFTGTLTR